MIKNIVKICLVSLAFAGFSTKTKATDFSVDVKRHFTSVTHNPTYIHLFGTGSAICSYQFLKNFIIKNFGASLNHWVIKAVSVLCAMGVSGVVQDHPDAATLVCLGALGLHILRQNGLL